MSFLRDKFKERVESERDYFEKTIRPHVNSYGAGETIGALQATIDHAKLLGQATCKNCRHLDSGRAPIYGCHELDIYEFPLEVDDFGCYKFEPKVGQ